MQRRPHRIAPRGVSCDGCAASARDSRCDLQPPKTPAGTPGIPAAHACQPPAPQVEAVGWQGAAQTPLQPPGGTSAIWALCTGWRVRRSCSCQYINGSNTSSAHWVHRGVMAICVKSWRIVCHHKSTRAGMPQPLADLVQVSFFIGSPLVSRQRLNRLGSSACNCSATSFGRLTARVGQPPGMQDVQTI